jgi:hypothetical protein
MPLVDGIYRHVSWFILKFTNLNIYKLSRHLKY